MTTMIWNSTLWKQNGQMHKKQFYDVFIYWKKKPFSQNCEKIRHYFGQRRICSFSKESRRVKRMCECQIEDCGAYIKFCLIDDEFWLRRLSWFRIVRIISSIWKRRHSLHISIRSYYRLLDRLHTIFRTEFFPQIIENIYNYIPLIEVPIIRFIKSPSSLLHIIYSN